MKLFFLRSLFFILIAYVLSVCLSWGYTALFTRYKSNQSKRNWTLVRKGDTMDYATIGSSRVFHMIDVPLLNTLMGKKGMNIGTSGSSFSDNYALLVKYLEHNQIKSLILNVDEMGFHSTTGYHYPFADYEYMPYFFEDTIRQIFKDNVPQWKYYLWTAIPISRYMEFNEHYEIGSLLWLNIKKPLCKLDTTDGTELLYNMRYKKFLHTDTLSVVRDTLNIEPRDEVYFSKILSLCRAKNIKIILVTTPLYGKGIYAPSNRLKFQAYIEQVAEKEKLPYINFYEAKGLQHIHYFRDMTHTNIQGTRLYTRYLASKLKDLEDKK
jgi:hypothetical protein